MAGYDSRPTGVADAWRSMTKTFMDMESPPWLESKSFCPSWWPSDCYHGRRLTVNAFVDGTIAPGCDDLGGGSNRAVFIDELYRGVHLYAYVTDLYDATNSAIWIDYDSIISCERCRRSGIYVVGTDGRSAFIDSRLECMLSQVMEGDWTDVADYPYIRFPKMSACQRVGSSITYLRDDDSYGMLGECSKLSNMDAIRTMALSPFHIPLHPIGNCFFSIFRECGDGDGASLGPIYANQIMSSELLDADEHKLRSVPGGKWLAASDGHIHVVKSWDEATHRVDLTDDSVMRASMSTCRHAGCPLVGWCR